MRFGHWLNSLTGTDQLVILVCFGLSLLLAHLGFKQLEQVYNNMQKDNAYANKFRVSPAIFLVAALFITVIVFMLIGRPITGWLQ